MSKSSEEYQIGDVETYQIIVDLAEEGIWILNPKDVIKFANKKLSSMLGYSKEELLGHSFYDIVAEQDKDIVKKALERRHKGVKEAYMVRLRKKDSELVWVTVAAAPILDKQGAYKGTVSLASDITLAKQYEEDLKKERSLANMYLDLMAHDINNLNQVAMGNLEMAIHNLQQETLAVPNILDLLQKSLDTMCQQTSLIKNVKTLQRLKTEQLRNEEVDVAGIITEAVSEFRNFPGREVTIEYQQPGNCFVRANGLLKEVFVNLIGNSVKHSQGPVRIWVTVDSAVETGKKFYEASLADDGPGIPDDLKERLFGRFKSGEAKTTGHGLGLYLVKSIVEDFGGKVRVEDRVHGDYHKGAKFVVLLPAAT